MPRTIDRRTFLATTAASSLALATSACSVHPQLDGPPNFLVYMPDSLRADALGCYGGNSGCSPTVDALARRSFVFDACVSQCCWTKPSVGSIFTGMTPRVHRSASTPWRAREGVEVPPRMLHPNLASLGESMQALGYRTACFQTNPHIREEFDYDRGFDHFDLVVNQPAAEQASQARQWLRRAKEPFFLFVHQIDPHGPYTPDAADFLEAHDELKHEAAQGVPEEDISRINTWTNAYLPEYSEQMPQARRSLPDLSPEGLRYLRMLYEAQIHRADKAFAGLVEELETQGHMDRTVIIFMSDHGEAFGEHGVFAHGNTLFIEELHVPLVVHLPRQRFQVRVPAMTGLYDIHPTCLTLAGGQPDSGMMAQPLLDESARLIAEPNRTLVAEWDYPGPNGNEWDMAVLDKDSAIVRHTRGEHPEVRFAFDMKSDPAQQNALNEETLDASEAWQERLQRFKDIEAHHRQLAERTGPPNIFEDADDDYEEQLRALGYV